jgi:G:T-mismatch repair DNA endonuclease (very short patch repair protein)
MESKIRNKIIREYKKGNSSLVIAKMVGLSRPTILKVLKDVGITRKRDRCKSLDIIKEDKKYYIIRKCPKCNKDIKTTSKDKTIACRNYINALNGGYLCKPCSLKLQEGKGNPFYGKKHTKNSIKKMSDSRSGKYTGNENHMKKKEYRDMSKNIMRSNWDNGILDRKVISEQMKQTRRSGKIKSTITSKKEREIVSFLRSLNIEVISSFRVDSKVCDIYIPSLNLIIEYNGDYWHCNPNKYDGDYFNQKKNKYAKDIWEYDSNKLELIRNYGYNLEVVWETDLKTNNDIILEIIHKYDKKHNFAPERS